MSKIVVDYGNSASGGAETPTLLFSNSSGVTTATYNATGYSRLIFVTKVSTYKPRMTFAKCPDTLQLATAMASGSTWYNNATVTASQTEFSKNDSSSTKILAVYGVKTNAFDVSEIITTWDC